MADTKISALTENTTPILTDLTVMVDDPSGTPVTQKINLNNLLQHLIAPTTSFTVNAGYSVYVIGPFEIASGQSLEIATGGCLEIG